MEPLLQVTIIDVFVHKDPEPQIMESAHQKEEKSSRETQANAQSMSTK
jgi:hypothetical protein